MPLNSATLTLPSTIGVTILAAGSGTLSSTPTAWATGTPFTVGQVVSYYDTLFVCATAHTAGATFDTTKFTPYTGSNTSGFRFRGPWASATAYKRGDIVVDPYGALRWCGVAHTSPTTFATGTELAANSPWWAPLPTNGVFRGIYQISHRGTYGTQYAPGDLVMDPTGTTLSRALFQDSATTVWTPGRYDDFGVLPVMPAVEPGLILPPHGMPNSKEVQGLGLYPRKTRLSYPHVKPLFVVNSDADFTSVTGGASTADSDPLVATGCPAFPFVGGSGVIATKQLGTTVDLSHAIVRFPFKIPGRLATNGLQVGVVGSTLSTGAAITNIPLNSTGLWMGVAPGVQVVLNDGAGHTQVFTCSDYVSANAGASVTKVPVNSLTPTFAFPAATTTISFLNRSGILTAAIQVSSDNFATTAQQFKFFDSSNVNVHTAFDAWSWGGTGPGGWIAVSGKSAPTMTAINAVRFVFIGSQAQITCSLHRVDVLPNNGSAGSKGDGRAKCVLWGDDSYAGHWTNWAPLMIKYGFPGCTAAAGALSASASVMSLTQQQHLAHHHGWQAAVHYYFAKDGGDDQLKDGRGKDTYMMRSRHSLLGSSLWGTDDFAWHDDDGMAAQNLPITRKNFRSCRGYSAGDTTLETLPPVNGDYIHAWGVATADVTGGTVAVVNASGVAAGTITSVPLDATGLTVNLAAGELITIGTQTLTVSTTTAKGVGVTSIPVNSQTVTIIAGSTAIVNPASAMKAQVDLAIANFGLVQFAWEDITSVRADITNILAYLDSQRANIDVVTISEALAPWTVTT